MKLLEFKEIENLLVENYDVSVGHISPDQELNIKNLNDGIVATNNITTDKIYHATSILSWQQGISHLKNVFYKNAEKIYVCLYAPNNVSLIAPSGSSLFNIILDDNYVWRYICDIDQSLFDNYVTLDTTNITERIKKGCVSSANIIINSGHQISDFPSFYLIGNYASGTGLSYVVENDQNTLEISDVLIQLGGTNYKNNDFIALTDTSHLISDTAVIDVYVEDGKVKLNSFTNGQNYSYLDIIIIGDGSGSSATFSTVAGVLTSLNVSEGSGYTWAKAIVVNSEKHVVAQLMIEPMNGYNCDLSVHIGPNKYIIETEFNNILSEINFYGLHKKITSIDGVTKYVQFDYMFALTEFVPLEDETVKTRIILG